MFLKKQSKFDRAFAELRQLKAESMKLCDKLQELRLKAAVEKDKQRHVCHVFAIGQAKMKLERIWAEMNEIPNRL